MSRRATIRTAHDDPEAVAAAIAPDNTDEMETVVEDGAVVTRIDRPTTGGLHATVDDYVVNLDVAVRVAATAESTHADDSTGTNERSDDTNTTETHDDTNE